MSKEGTAMMHIKKILFPTDYSRCSDQALVRALWFAEHYGAQLHVVHALLPLDFDPHNVSHHLPDLEGLQRQIDRLTSVRAPAYRSYSEVEIISASVRGIAAAPAVLTYAAENDIDLIVMGTHGRRGINHLLLGSVAEEIVRMSPCPVLTVRETTPETIEPKSILVPLDFSDFSSEAFSVARTLAADVGATIRALHVIEETIHPSFYVTGQTSLQSWYPEVEASAVKEMRRIAEKAWGPEVPVEYHVKEGRAPVDIVAFAKRNDIQLIVMASHGLSGIEHLLLGSVTEKVVRLAPCPVFTVKSFGRSLISKEQFETATAR
jgi:nucleotide-binding universal stress UspA family protein